jgi:hypothetical protein
MASRNLVGIEKACLDAIKTEDLLVGGLPEGFELGQEGHLFQRVHGKNPFIQLRELEKRGLGSLEYQLSEIQ